MAKQSPDPSVVLGILLDRVLGTPAKESAEKWGYKTASLSALAKRYNLDDVETKLRMALASDSSAMTPEAIRVNEAYSEMAKKLEDQINQELDQKRTLSDFANNPLDLTRYHSTMAGAMAKARDTHLSIAGLQSDSKRKKKEEKPEEVKTAFEDLLEDVDEGD